MSGTPLDFPPPPAAPTVGDTFSGPLGVTWLWDGQKWTAGGGPGGGPGGITDAPMDGTTYGRNNGDWVNVLPLQGGTMQGPIILQPGVPANPLAAVTKQYVDELASLSGLYQGTWSVAANTPDISMGGIEDSQNYLAITANPNQAEQAPTNIPGIGGQMVNNGDRIVWTTALSIWQRIPGDSLDLQIGDSRYLQLAGGTMTGDEYFTVGNGTAYYDTQGSPGFMHVDNSNTLSFSITDAGGGQEMLFSVPMHTDSSMLTIGLDSTFNGAVWLSGDPVALLQAATKQYVDSRVGAVSGALLFVGTINGATGQCQFTAASSITPNPGPLPPAPNYPNVFVVCDNPGVVPGGPADGMALSAGDWVVSDGVFWNHIAIGSSGLLAQDIMLSPTILGATNVQQALQNIIGNYLPLTGGSLSGHLWIAAPNNLIVGGITAPNNIGPSQLLAQYTSTTWRGFNTYISAPGAASYLANGFANALVQDGQGNLAFLMSPNGVAGTPIPSWTEPLAIFLGGGIQVGGGQNIGYPLSISVGGGGNANILMTVNGVRQWYCGLDNDGQFHIADLSAGSDRMIFGLGGNINVYGPGLVYGWYSAHSFAFLWDGSYVQIVVDGGSQGQYAPIGFNDGRYLYRAGDSTGGGFTFGYVGCTGSTITDGDGNYGGSVGIGGNLYTNGIADIGSTLNVSGYIYSNQQIWAYDRMVIGSGYPAYVMWNTAEGVAGCTFSESGGIHWAQTDGDGNGANVLSSMEWNGWFYVSGGIGTPSDEHLKENIRDSDPFNSLAAIRNLRFRQFNWKSDGHHQPHGLIASEVRPHLSDVIRTSKAAGDLPELDHLDLTSLLVHTLRAVQQLADRMGV